MAVAVVDTEPGTRTFTRDHDRRDRLGGIDGERCPVIMLTGDR
ncbi:hypothetical protein [Streptomyces endocoffeicus]|nr:hypothetical protein [Streptomyces endocoffeicus]